MADLGALATETSDDFPGIWPVVLGNQCSSGDRSECAFSHVKADTTFTTNEPGFVAGHWRYTWGGALLALYSVSDSRAVLTYTSVKLFETEEQAQAAVEALAAVDKAEAKRLTNELLESLDQLVTNVSLLKLEDGEDGDLGDHASGKKYTFAASGVLVDVHEVRFARGRAAVRVILAGSLRKVQPESAIGLGRIIEERIEPFILAR